MTHGRQQPKERRAQPDHKRVPFTGQLCHVTGKMCWTRDMARQQARDAVKRDPNARVGWYRCSHCAWFHLGHG